MNPLQPVAALAALKGHIPVFRFALDKGARIHLDVAVAVQKGSKTSPEMATYHQENKAIVDSLLELKPDSAKLARPHIPMEQRNRIDERIGR